MNVVNILIALLSNPGIQALIKEIMDMLQKKPAGQGIASDEATVKQVVHEVVARRVK